MGTMISTGTDVVAFLKAQHEQIKQGFNSVLGATGNARAKAFLELRRLLAVHETAEEEIVHPAARRELANGERVVTARLNEEKKAKQALIELESYPVDSPQFDVGLRALHQDVVAHAESEEREEFALLASRLDTSRLERMRKAVAFAESIAPTRPHPGIESAAANMLAGPFVAMIDRARDALTRTS